jgi:phosphoserine phosphatase
MRASDPAQAQVCVLTADPGARALGPSDVEAAARALAAAGAAVEAHRWLAELVAAELPYRGVDGAAAGAAVRDALRDRPLDVNCLAAAGRRKAVLVADMDSTIVTGETLDELAEAVGLKRQIAPITARAMNGELDFAEALEQRVAMLEGLAESAVQATLGRLELTAGARTLVATMAAHGADTALVTGGFTAIAEPVADRCGFARVVANRLELDGGRLTGRVAHPIVDKTAKLATLRDLADTRGVHVNAALAVGDGANDLPMLQEAGLGVAFRAKPAVKAAAALALDHGDLTGLLYLQGYARDDFAS